MASQRRALGVLFGALALLFVGIGYAAARGGAWLVAGPAVALAVWLGSLSAGALRRR